MCSQRFQWIVLLSQSILLSVSAQPSSAALAEARNCLMAGGKLNLFRELDGSRHYPRCLMSGGCPRGSTEVSGSCVAPVIFGEAREIALTLHAPCTSCADDHGLELAGKLWLSLAAALQVPLQETKASVLLMGRQVWKYHPLQHFTLTKTGEGPLVTNQGGRLRQSALDAGESWDLFMAVRIHTSRVSSSDVSLAELLVNYAGPILDVLGQNNGVEVFEIRTRKTAQLTHMNYMTARFKIHELPWGEEPPPLQSSYFPPAPQPPSPPPPPAPEPTTVSTTMQSTTLAPTETTSPTTTPGPSTSTTERCRCHLTWLGDGVCDHHCNTESCKWDGGDCPPKTSSQALSATSKAWAESFQQTTTTTTSTIQILATYRNQASLTQGESRRRSTQSQSPIVSMEVDETDRTGLHIVATSDGRSWSADDVPKEYASGNNEPSPILIAAFIVALLCILPAICCLARRRNAHDIVEKGSQSQKMQHDSRDDDPFMEMRGSSKDRYSTDSGVSTETGGDSPQSWSFFSTSPMAKEPKVHPEPDPEDPQETNGGNSFGGWRLPASTPTSGKSPAAKQQGFRPEAPKWERPSQPSQPPSPSYWNDRREQERSKRQREQDEREKAADREVKEERDAWQQQWRQNKREQDREKKLQEEELRQHQKQQEKERKEHQKEQEKQEKERRRKEQEQEWKRQEEELRRKHMAEKEAHERRQAEAKRQREEEERRQAQRQKEEDQRRQQTTKQKQQQKAEKAAKKKDWTSTFFSFGARSRAASEPPRSRAASEPPSNSGRGPSTSAEDRGNNHTRWAGFDGRGPGGSAATERTAQDAAEQRAREKAQQEASKKANSLLDRVMKQLDSTRSSPLEERKKVFRELQRQLHPDKNPDDQEAAKLAFQRLMENRDSYLS